MGYRFTTTTDTLVSRKDRAKRIAASAPKCANLAQVYTPERQPPVGGALILIGLSPLARAQGAIAAAMPATEKAAPRGSQTVREHGRQRARRFAIEHADNLDKIRATPSAVGRKAARTRAKYGV